MLIVVPLGLWFAALVFDLIAVFSGNPMWRTIAFWNIAVGIIGALAAAVPGFLDYLAMRGRARRIGTWHMILNLGAVVVFSVNAFVRTRVSLDSAWPLALSLVGVVGVLISGWLGGEMVYVERAGVDEAVRKDQARRAA
jgi:uncharacterized membrane protein